MNFKTAHHIRFIFIFSMLLAFSLQSCVSGKAARNKSIKEWEKQEWKVVKVDKEEVPSWKIYSRKVKGTNFLEYKIEGGVNTTPATCLETFKQDLYQHKDEGMQKKYPTYKITEESETSLLTYVVHKEPFPLKDTEMSVRYLFYRNEDNSTAVKWNEAWNDCPIPASKKLKRIESFMGSWNFSPTSKGASNAVKVVRFNPNKMPRWLYEPMVVKFLKEGLKDLRRN